jgi:hypothetical protein
MKYRNIIMKYGMQHRKLMQDRGLKNITNM